ncbi:SDR family NAD(P)-dependent oxidoreductase [Cellulomonas sp. ATA003]|uniref:SDR family NAD(P)-dependent oxidoreductase n=1 Tax=Cellulomonas sp. ATA003 TaxID=3073064 RepID=UPI002873B7A2|nr:SDR family NAD(P)-dependent oxidoreductase [Cellulomonas sp. ATA003]WNB86263.1 SDR family NAD(P)-dependent oxidoreductase [Cellulomonas sp. ATA003]
MTTPSSAPPVPPVEPRVALVTGAGRGIGRELAVGLADAGYAVGLVARSRGPLEEVAARCAQSGVRTAVATADLAVPDDARRAVAEIEAALGAPGLVVNNAGVIEQREVPFGEDDPDDVWRVIETNVRGPLLVTHATLPGMIARGGGRVVNINSGSGHRVAGSYTGYGISKGALARFTALLDHQYRDAGVRTLDLAPGVVVTDMTQGMPVHDDRTDWTDPADVVALLLGFAEGRLDALSGRFVRAGTDTVESLLEHADAILAADARLLRLAPYGPGDPVA